MGDVGSRDWMSERHSGCYFCNSGRQCDISLPMPGRNMSSSAFWRYRKLSVTLQRQQNDSIAPGDRASDLLTVLRAITSRSGKTRIQGPGAAKSTKPCHMQGIRLEKQGLVLIMCVDLSASPAHAVYDM